MGFFPGPGRVWGCCQPWLCPFAPSGTRGDIPCVPSPPRAAGAPFSSPEQSGSAFFDQHLGNKKGLSAGPVMDGSGRPLLCSLPSFHTNEIPFITSYSHKPGLSQEETSAGAVPAAIPPIPAFSRGVFLVSSGHKPARPPAGLTLIYSLFLVLPKGENLVFPRWQSCIFVSPSNNSCQQLHPSSLLAEGDAPSQGLERPRAPGK